MLFKEAARLALVPTMIALFITPIRFSLELAGVPDVYVFLIGLLWLTLAVSVYWGRKVAHQQGAFLLLLTALAIFSPLSRIPVFIMWWITKTWQLGTHYDIFDNWVQALTGQLFYGSLIQIIPGFLLGSMTILIVRRKQR